jgi:hypothetical protein
MPYFMIHLGRNSVILAYKATSIDLENIIAGHPRTMLKHEIGSKAAPSHQ